MTRDPSERRHEPLPLDRDTTERLLRGAVAPDDSPPGYADVARLVGGLQAPPAPAELRGFEHVAAAFATPRPRRRRRRLQLVTVVAAAGVVTFGGLAAANALPAPAQRVTANVLHTIGVRVPSPSEPMDDPEAPSAGIMDGGERGPDTSDEPATTTTR